MRKRKNHMFLHYLLASRLENELKKSRATPDMANK